MVLIQKYDLNSLGFFVYNLQYTTDIFLCYGNKGYSTSLTDEYSANLIHYYTLKRKYNFIERHFEYRYEILGRIEPPTPREFTLEIQFTASRQKLGLPASFPTDTRMA